jgi:hypothetical protein
MRPRSRNSSTILARLLARVPAGSLPPTATDLFPMMTDEELADLAAD